MTEDVELVLRDFNTARDELIHQAIQCLANTELLDEVDIAGALQAASEYFTDRFDAEQRSWWQELHSA